LSYSSCTFSILSVSGGNLPYGSGGQQTLAPNHFGIAGAPLSPYSHPSHPHHQPSPLTLGHHQQYNAVKYTSDTSAPSDLQRRASLHAAYPPNAQLDQATGRMVVEQPSPGSAGAHQKRPCRPANGKAGRGRPPRINGHVTSSQPSSEAMLNCCGGEPPRPIVSPVASEGSESLKSEIYQKRYIHCVRFHFFPM